jgi:phage FluMu gp28-like protein
MEVTSNFIPYPKQMEVINGIINSDVVHHVLCSSRQVGKTIMAENLLLYYAINYPDSYNVLVSPVFSQSKKSFMDLAKAAGPNNPLIATSNASELIMTFKNGSVIRMVSAESGQNLRGFTVSGLLVLDEAAFVPEDVWTTILRPTTLIRGKKVLFISTPNGTNWFKKIFDWGLDPEYKDWSSYRITSYENPYLDLESLELARKTLPEKTYLQEYLGVFLEGGGSVFSGFAQCATLESLQTKPEAGRRYFAGLDLAVANDYTVLSVFNDQGILVDFYRQNKTSWEEIIGDVTQRINHWKCYTIVEKNSIGSVVSEQLAKACPNLIEAFTTTNASKKDIIESLKLSFADKLIQIPKKDVLSILHMELSIFAYKMLPSGLISYSAPSGASDDCVLSLAFANRALTQGKSKGTYSVYTGATSRLSPDNNPQNIYS